MLGNLEFAREFRCGVGERAHAPVIRAAAIDDAPAVAGTALLISAHFRAVGIDFVPDDARMRVIDG
jgi:hypothetical protein